jgi:hypothetical protein
MLFQAHARARVSLSRNPRNSAASLIKKEIKDVKTLYAITNLVEAWLKLQIKTLKKKLKTENKRNFFYALFSESFFGK